MNNLQSWFPIPPFLVWLMLSPYLGSYSNFEIWIFPTFPGCFMPISDESGSAPLWGSGSDCHFISVFPWFNPSINVVFPVHTLIFFNFDFHNWRIWSAASDPDCSFISVFPWFNSLVLTCSCPNYFSWYLCPHHIVFEFSFIVLPFACNYLLALCLN